jgi:hypothetical protein
MINLTREEAQQVLDALSDCREDSEELFYDYKQKYGDHYKPQRITFQQSVLDQSAQAIETLRARLSAPEPPCKTGSQCIGGKCPQCVVSEPEPVAWLVRDYVDGLSYPCAFKDPAGSIKGESVPLYLHPPQREWHGLTDAEVTACWKDGFDSCEQKTVADLRDFIARAIEAKMKEKNT